MSAELDETGPGSSEVSIVRCFVTAYNAFDIDAMFEHIHDDVLFQHVANGAVTVETQGKAVLRALAEQSKKAFSERRQNIESITITSAGVCVGVSYRAVPAQEMQSGGRRGEGAQVLEGLGESEFRFTDGKIMVLIDRT